MLRTLGIASSFVVVVYVILSGFARRPLTLNEFWIFGAAVVRATPAHLRGSNPLETLRLGGGAFGSPTETTTLSAGGRAYTIPLPPRTKQTENGAQAERFVTFATPDEMRHYLRVTLPRAGWNYREQLGSVHALERRDLLLSVQSTFYRGTRVGELRISLLARPRHAA